MTSSTLQKVLNTTKVNLSPIFAKFDYHGLLILIRIFMNLQPFLFRKLKKKLIN